MTPHPLKTALLAAVLAAATWIAPAAADDTEEFEAAVRLAEQRKYEEAASRLRVLAQRGHPGAQYNLGFLYDMGYGVAQDFYAAFNWYSLAADSGLAEAQYNIGVMYYLGRGVDQDIGKAVEWYERAANGGLAEAQTNLGYFHETGQGVEKDLAKAVDWYRKAAEAGSDKAQFNLAYLLVKGQGVPHDIVAAYKWFTLASMRGHEEAGRNRVAVAKAMTPEQLQAGDRMVRAYIAEKKGAAAGDR